MNEQLYNLFYRVIFYNNTNFKNYSAEEIVNGTSSWYIDMEDYNSAECILEASPDEVLDAFAAALEDYNTYEKKTNPLVLDPTILSEAIKTAKNTDKVFNLICEHIKIKTLEHGAGVYNYIHNELAKDKNYFDTLMHEKPTLVTFIEQIAKKTKTKILEG